jgi:elongin-A
MRPVLRKLERPEQLHILEQNSPQLYENNADSEIWMMFIKRDIPNYASKPHQPKNPANWYKVYKKLLAEVKSDIEDDALILKATMDKLAEERAKHTSKIVDPRTMPKLPRMGGMRAEAQKRAQATVRTADSSVLRFTSGSKTKMTTGKGVMDRARREARELSLFSARKAPLAVPTHKLGNKSTVIKSAPQGLVAGHKRAVPAYLENTATRIFAPRRTGTVQSPNTVTAGQHTTDGEARLRALTSGRIPKTPTTGSTSSSDKSLGSTNTSMSTAQSPPKPPMAYSIPRMKADGAVGAMQAKKRQSADCFMPAKRRRIS